MVRGEAGSGKSTLFRWAAMQAAWGTRGVIGVRGRELHKSIIRRAHNAGYPEQDNISYTLNYDNIEDATLAIYIDKQLVLNTSLLTNLTRLILGRTQVSDLSPLAGLSSLQILDLSGKQVSDLLPLARLSSLTALNLAGAQVSDLSPLAGLSSLQNLNLYETQVSDLSPLERLVKKGLEIHR